MEWSNQQATALKSVSDWLKDKAARKYKKHFYLAGHAGSGKTTIARHFADDLGHVEFGAYTGKAAQVMRNKGCPNATTIHRLIYNYDGKDFKGKKEMLAVQEQARKNRDLKKVLEIEKAIEAEEKKSGTPLFALKECFAVEHVSLLILDECSMISEQMANDILSFGIPVLVLGDPAQLPPVKGAGFFTSQKPDFLLTEIHRQARDNPILDLATRVRKGERLSMGNYGDSKVVPVGKVSIEELLKADIVLTGKNKTRMNFNRRARKELNRDHSLYPVKDDKLICLKNLHKAFLYNGTTFTALADAEVEELGGGAKDLVVPVLLDDPDVKKPRVLDITPEYFEKYKDEDYEDPRDPRTRTQQLVVDADYAYALTVHKSQGSQWEHVVVVDDEFALKWWPPKPELRKQFLYTAITRASEKITIGLSRRA